MRRKVFASGKRFFLTWGDMTADQLQRSLDCYKGLVEVSALITSITDFDELLSAILEVARRVMKAEASSLFLAQPDGSLRLALARHSASGATMPIIVPRGRGIAGWVLENGTPLLVPDAYADPRFYPDADKASGFQTRSILCAPLGGRESRAGVLQVLNPAGKTSFDELDLEAFGAYAQLAGTALEKLQTLRQQREQDLLEQQLALAHEIQNSFLPQTLPQQAGCSFAAIYRPALNIGGDFYDVLAMSTDEIYFVIGDVSGKGIPAALLMAQSLSMLRFILQPGLRPGEALARWNRTLCGHTIRGLFITALLGRIVPSQRTVQMACAGHCPPLRLRAGAVHEVELHAAPPIGVLENLVYDATSVTLDADEWLVFFTDGLTESFSEQEQLLDRDGVRRLLQHPFASASAVAHALRHGEEKHRHPADPHDDLTVLVFGFQ